ncbi:MAG TPA: primosomal protein N' [Bacteroidota bacterium]|nr:primosomal protein N' [Bacteroidota bacterium]
MKQFFADIALPVPVDHTFTYFVPPELQPLALPGMRVLVPFGRKYLTGVIVGLPETSNVKGLKPIRDILDSTPSFSAEMLALAKWIADYYLAPLGEVLRAATPQGFTQESKKFIQLTSNGVLADLASIKKSAPKQFAVLQALADGKALSLSHLQKKTSVRSIAALACELQLRGWVSLSEEIEKQKAKPKLEKIVSLTAVGISLPAETRLTEKLEAVRQQLLAECAEISSAVELRTFLNRTHTSLSSLKTLEKKGLVKFGAREIFRISEYDAAEPPPKITLNPHQQLALEKLTEALNRKNFRAFLLYGITGSGKTQVYIEAIRHTLAMKKTAIVLVPEISLTPQTVRRFKAHFGNNVAVMHSQMSIGERFDAWRMARDKKVHIVIGPRSAIFAPLENIGLIVVDEEHEGSYKQYDSTPRYHARDVAVVRASQNHAVVLLGSATPSVESYFNAHNGKYTLLELPERIDTAKLPFIEIVDMAKERKQVYENTKEEVKLSGKEFPKHLPPSSLSKLLRMHMEERLARKEGIILLQNRRGFSHVMECYECGHVERCDNCEVSLTYHATKKHLRCHYCGFVKKPPTICPQCGNTEMRLYAFGTQQVQEELQQMFPKAAILRMDRDTTSHRGAHHRILQQFENGEADILLGTQMVAKGLDFPRVTLVGVISADTQMLLPDFRASEGTFQLLTQVAGRAGRSTLAGEVVIQTLQPSHYSLKFAKTHDFLGFYREELEHRRELNYPPFSRIVLIEFSGMNESDVQHHAKKFSELLAQHNTQKRFLVLGPADAAIPKINNRFRKQLVIKDLKTLDPSASFLRGALQKAKTQYAASPLGKSQSIKLTIDIDPAGML